MHAHTCAYKRTKTNIHTYIQTNRRNGRTQGSGLLGADIENAPFRFTTKISLSTDFVTAVPGMYIHVYVGIVEYAHINMYRYICVYTYIYTHTYMYMYVYMYA